MRSFSSVLALILLHTTTASSCSAVVTDPVKSLTYTGYTSNATDSFLNIPFGLSTGLNRFGPPQAYIPTNGTVYNNTVAGAVCPQQTKAASSYASAVLDISEDCLNLKVVRPEGTTAESKLPVMVYIYGGGLFTGQAYERTQGGEGLVKQSVENGLPVVFVAMNYRLNIFGFALSEALRGNQSLNAGLKDQRLALEWVQENIALFGGDPDRVTIFGQSSGALSVGLQLLAYGGTRGAPFQGAIIESTALEPTMTSNLTRDTYDDVAALAGCAPYGTDPQSLSTLTCLRELSMETLLNITLAQQTSTSADNDGDTYLPTIDQDFLPLAASELVALGNFTHMPVIAGWTKDDAAPFTSTSITLPNETRAMFEEYYTGLSSTTLDTLLSLYPVSDFAANEEAGLSQEFYRSAQIFRDILLTCPNFLLGAAMAKKCDSAADNACPGFYIYMQNQTILGPDSGTGAGLGVVHTSELAYVFGDIASYNVTNQSVVHTTDADWALMERASRSWSTFANVGVPSLKGRTTLGGWESSFDGWEGDSEGVNGTKVYVIGGANEGLVGLNEGAFAWQRLEERCGFLNSEEVVNELQY